MATVMVVCRENSGDCVVRCAAEIFFFSSIGLKRVTIFIYSVVIFSILCSDLLCSVPERFVEDRHDGHVGETE